MIDIPILAEKLAKCSDKDEMEAELLEVIRATAETCAVVAWITGMDTYKNRLDGRGDCRAIGSRCAKAIREICWYIDASED